jgi:hypothetical protein
MDDGFICVIRGYAFHAKATWTSQQSVSKWKRRSKAIVVEVFGLPRPELPVDWYRFSVCSPEGVHSIGDSRLG